MIKHISEPWYTHLTVHEPGKLLRKIKEGRVSHGIWTSNLVGQELIITNLPPIDGQIAPRALSARVRVINVTWYLGVDLRAAITSMLAVEGLDKMLPGVTSLEDGVEIYLRFNRNDSATRIGAFEFQLLD